MFVYYEQMFVAMHLYNEMCKESLCDWQVCLFLVSPLLMNVNLNFYRDHRVKLAHQSFVILTLWEQITTRKGFYNYYAPQFIIIDGKQVI